jgi:ribulose-phosphate 3-epimerase
MQLAPSILAADLADLAGALRLCEDGGADWVHVDVMDGRFVPNLTFGIPVVAALKRRTRLPLDVHLMVEEPSRLMEEYVRAGAAGITVHWEAETHLHRALTALRQWGVRAGVALNPATPVELLQDVLGTADHVLLMSVNPGFAGQAFIPETLEKARRLQAMARRSGRPLSIGMDGGLGRGNIRAALLAGVDFAVAGSAVFAAADPVQEMLALRQAAHAETV